MRVVTFWPTLYMCSNDGGSVRKKIPDISVLAKHIEQECRTVLRGRQFIGVDWTSDPSTWHHDDDDAPETLPMLLLLLTRGEHNTRRLHDPSVLVRSFTKDAMQLNHAGRRQAT